MSEDVGTVPGLAIAEFVAGVAFVAILAEAFAAAALKPEFAVVETFAEAG